MKFTVSSSALNQRLQNLRGVIGGKSTIAILDSFLFEFDEQKLTLTASDSDNRLTTTMEVIENDTCQARFCINAKTILDTLKELSEQPLTFQVDLERQTINATYCNGEFNITCQKAEDYPLPAAVEGDLQTITMPASAMLDGISRCFTCTKDDEIRPVMNGILMDSTPEKTTFVATDGHKLMRSTTSRSTTEATYSVIIPKKAATLLRSLLAKDAGDVQVTTNSKMLYVKTTDSELRGKLIEGRYPNYNAVIPSNNPHHIIVDRMALLSATKRVALFSSQSSSLVKLRFENGTCTISGQDYEFATSAEEHINCQHDGQIVTIGFKGNLLSEMLSLVDCTQVRLELADPSKPGLIIPTETMNDDEIVMLIMPMMVKD